MIALSRRFGRIAVAFAIALTVDACSGGGAPNSPAPAALPTAANRSQTAATTCATAKTAQACVQHVVVVLLENRSFDNMFHFYDHNKANIADFGYDHATKVTLGARSFSETSDVDHSHYPGFVKEYDNGLNDGWGDVSTDRVKGRLYPYGYVPKSEIQPYLDMANQFAISDNFFHGVQAPTYPSHLEIGAGTSFGVYDNPSVGIPWGCDAAAGTTTGTLNADGVTTSQTGPFPCFSGLSLFDLLDRKNVTWRYYSEPEGQSISGNLVIPASFRSQRYGIDWTSKIATTDTEIDTAITAGTLPQVSFVIPDSSSTDHAGTPSQGPMYVENLENLIGQSATYYDNTLVIVTWDDWGGWYDHVVPPTVTGTPLSYRKPIIFMNPYVKYYDAAKKTTGYVSHVQTEDASIAKTLETLFGLDSLGTHDVRAADFMDVFDFTQTPHPYVPITSVETTMPTSANPNFVIRPAAVLGRHDGKPYDVNAYYKAKAVDY
jgi:phospholipase C